MQCPHKLLQARDTADAEKKIDNLDVPRGLDCNHFCTKVKKWNAKKKKRMLSINLQFCCQHELLFLEVQIISGSFLPLLWLAALWSLYYFVSRALNSIKGPKLRGVFWGRQLKSHSLHTPGGEGTHLRIPCCRQSRGWMAPHKRCLLAEKTPGPNRTYPGVFFAPPSHILGSVLKYTHGDTSAVSCCHQSTGWMTPQTLLSG